MLIKRIKKDIIQAMKDKNEVKKDILRVIVGEVQLAESKLPYGKDLSEEKVCAIMRKLVESNNIILENKNDPKLVEENKIIETYLPKTLEIKDIVVKLQPVREEVLAAQNDGTAMGVAMKYLKQERLSVLGADVREAVNIVRND